MIPIPNETAQPNPEPKKDNPIESRLMQMNTKEELQRELNSVRANYQKWKEKGDQLPIRTQTRFAQIIHFRSHQLEITLQ